MSRSSPLNRRDFIASAAVVGAGSTLFPVALQAQVAEDGDLTLEQIAAAEAVAGTSFTPEQRALMLSDLQERLDDYAQIRAVPLRNDVIPALRFDPDIAGIPPPPGKTGMTWVPPVGRKPASDEDLAFQPVSVLSGLLRRREVTSLALTELYLRRLRKYDPVLQAVVSYTEERAIRQATEADAELDAGMWRGPLHGVPWGAKDLLAVRGYPTTWGAMPYRDQFIDRDAAVVERLDEAGAVLIAKLTLGALAMGDVWFGGKTKNPWNIEQGSSGSSAGPGSAVAAGLVGFAIGSETLGSIVSPSNRNGVTGLRPTFGRVSRYGAMTLSWSMDKLGPMCRSAEDCALVFGAIQGQDPRDPTSRDVAFEWPTPGEGVRLGYVPELFEIDRERPASAADVAALEVLRELGYDLVPIALPDLPASALMIGLSAEAGAAFAEPTRSGSVDSMVRQDRGAWPNSFRKAQLIPAVDYINANRVRTLLMQQMASVMADVDVFVSPSFRGGTLSITNLTGHPSVTVPNRFDPLEETPASVRRQPGSITFVGGLYQDHLALAVAQAYQEATDFHLRRPPIR